MKRHGDNRVPGTTKDIEAPLSMRVILGLCRHFPFSDKARVVAVEKLFNEARATLSAQSAWVRLTFQHNIPASQCMDQGIIQLINLLLVCVSEFHLTRSIRGCGPMIPPKIEGWLRDIRDYLPHDNAGYPSTDVREKDKANLKRLAFWFHCLNMVFSYSRGTAESLRKEDHQEIGNLLHYLIAQGLGTLTSTKVIEQVLRENEDNTLRQLEEAKDNLQSDELRLPQIEEDIEEARREFRHIQQQHTARPSDVQCAQQKYERLCRDGDKRKEYLKQCRYEIVYCEHYLDRQPPAEAPEWAVFALEGISPHLNPLTVKPLPQGEGTPPPTGQNPLMEEDVEMQDEALQGAVGGRGATSGASPITQEDEELLNEEDTPQTQVISNMKNLTVCSPSNPTSSQPETKL